MKQVRMVSWLLKFIFTSQSSFHICRLSLWAYARCLLCCVFFPGHVCTCSSPSSRSHCKLHLELMINMHFCTQAVTVTYAMKKKLVLLIDSLLLSDQWSRTVMKINCSGESNALGIHTHMSNLKCGKWWRDNRRHSVHMLCHSRVQHSASLLASYVYFYLFLCV